MLIIIITYLLPLVKVVRILNSNPLRTLRRFRCRKKTRK